MCVLTYDFACSILCSLLLSPPFPSGGCISLPLIVQYLSFQHLIHRDREFRVLFTFWPFNTFIPSHFNCAPPPPNSCKRGYIFLHLIKFLWEEGANSWAVCLSAVLRHFQKESLHLLAKGENNSCPTDWYLQGLGVKFYCFLYIKRKILVL